MACLAARLLSSGQKGVARCVVSNVCGAGGARMAVARPARPVQRHDTPAQVGTPPCTTLIRTLCFSDESYMNSINICTTFC